MTTALLLLLLTASALADPAKGHDTLAVKAARAWLATVLDAKATVAAPSKDKPLDYVIASPAKSCEALRSGHATTAAAATRVQKCMVDTWKSLADSPPATRAVREWEPDKGFGGFDKKYHKGMKASAKDATIVQAEHIGDGFTMTVSIVVAKDGGCAPCGCSTASSSNVGAC
jgi:hypothetical protein